MIEPVLLDTGPLVAILHKRDAQHMRCIRTMKDLRGGLVTCWPVLTEAAWLLRMHPRAIQRLMDGVSSGAYLLAELPKEAAKWIGTFLARYGSQRAQLADAALMYLAERERIETVFTLDRRDFSLYRLTSGRTLQMVPEV